MLEYIFWSLSLISLAIVFNAKEILGTKNKIIVAMCGFT